MKKSFVHVHSSSRYDRSVESLDRAVERYVKIGSLVTFTEVAFEWREKPLKTVPGWGHVLGDISNRDEAGIIFDKSVWELEWSTTRVVHKPQFYTQGGHVATPMAAVFAVLKHKDTGKRLLVTCMHLPSSVEGRKGLTGKWRKVRDWRAALKNWRKMWNAIAKQKGVDGILVTADWNLNIERALIRALYRPLLPKMTLVFNARKAEKGGTHGKRWIDYSFIRGLLRIKRWPWLLIDDASSDHRPFAEELTWA